MNYNLNEHHKQCTDKLCTAEVLLIFVGLDNVVSFFSQNISCLFYILWPQHSTPPQGNSSIRMCNQKFPVKQERNKNGVSFNPVIINLVCYYIVTHVDFLVDDPEKMNNGSVGRRSWSQFKNKNPKKESFFCCTLFFQCWGRAIYHK